MTLAGEGTLATPHDIIFPKLQLVSLVSGCRVFRSTQPVIKERWHCQLLVTFYNNFPHTLPLYLLTTSVLSLELRNHGMGGGRVWVGGRGICVYLNCNGRSTCSLTKLKMLYILVISPWKRFGSSQPSVLLSHVCSPRNSTLRSKQRFPGFHFVMFADLWQSDGGGRSAFPDRSDRSRRLPAQVHRTDHNGGGHHARRPLRLQSRCQVLRDLLGSGHLVSKQVVVCHSDIKNITREQIPWLMRAMQFMSVIKGHKT